MMLRDTSLSIAIRLMLAVLPTVREEGTSASSYMIGYQFSSTLQLVGQFNQCHIKVTIRRHSPINDRTATLGGFGESSIYSYMNARTNLVDTKGIYFM